MSSNYSYRKYLNNIGDNRLGINILSAEEFEKIRQDDYAKVRESYGNTYGDYLLVKGYNDRKLFGDADTIVSDSKKKSHSFQGRIQGLKNLQSNYDDLFIRNEKVQKAADRLVAHNKLAKEVEDNWYPYESDDYIRPSFDYNQNRAGISDAHVGNYKSWGEYYKAQSAYYKGSARNEWIKGMEATRNAGLAVRHKDQTSKNKVYRPNMDSDGTQSTDIGSWGAGLGIY